MSARCATVDPEIWFAYEDFRRDSKVRAAAEAQAKAICERCVLLVRCRAYGLETRQPFGIWGGLTLDERENVLGGGPDATRITPLQVVYDAPYLEVLEDDHGETQAA